MYKTTLTNMTQQVHDVNYMYDIYKIQYANV